MTRSILLLPEEADTTSPTLPKFSQVAKLSSRRTEPTKAVREVTLYFDDLVAVEGDPAFFMAMGERARDRRLTERGGA